MNSYKTEIWKKYETVLNPTAHLFGTENTTWICAHTRAHDTYDDVIVNIQIVQRTTTNTLNYSV